MSARPPDHQPAFDPVAERLVDIGRYLREARQQRGEDLYDVADYLRIKPSYLFALEEGDLAGMPGRTYALGFLRTYADHLDFDGAEVVRQLKATGEPETSLQVRQPVAENRLPGFGVVTLVLVLAAVAYGGWFAAQSGDDVFARLEAVPGEIGQYAASMFEEAPAAPMTASIGNPDGDAPLARLSASTEPPVETTDQTSVTAAASASAHVADATGADSGVRADEATSLTSAADRPAEDRPAEDRATADRADGRSTDSAAAGATAASDAEAPLEALLLDAEAERAAALRRLDEERPDAGTVGELLAALQVTADGTLDGAAANGDASVNGDYSGAARTAGAAGTIVSSDTGRITLVAREASWIQVQSPGRDFMQSTTLQPGERFDLPDRTDLALWTGNAGGLEVWVDGRKLGVLGASGAVMRDVTLTPEALRARL